MDGQAIDRWMNDGRMMDRLWMMIGGQWIKDGRIMDDDRYIDGGLMGDGLMD